MSGSIIENQVEYIETLLWIRTKTGRLRPFFLNSVQKERLRCKARKILILKSRRTGMTTLEQALSFHQTATNFHQQAATLAHDADSTEKIFRIANLFYAQLDPLFRPLRLSAHNKRDLNFPTLNSLYYVGTAGARAFGRGDTLQRVHWSEVAWSPGKLEDQRTFLAGLSEACSEGEMVLESTPNGVGDLFHELCTRARQDPKSEWKLLFFPWWKDSDNRIRDLNPDDEADLLRTLSGEEKELQQRAALSSAQLAWRRRKRSELKELFFQEYPEDPETAFLTSGECFFDRLLVERMLGRADAFQPVELREDGQILIFKRPERGHQYVIGADSAEGTLWGDFSTFTILECADLEHVASGRGRWTPSQLALILAGLGGEYGDALIAPERNNHGHSTLNSLRNQHQYPNLYSHRSYNAHIGKHVEKPGFPTDEVTRPLMLNELRQTFTEGQLEIRDRRLLEEFRTFEHAGEGRYEARSGHHDDLLISLAIALQARKRAFSRPGVEVI